jgi:uncharacterized membrane protein YphA (DoxX/SURF4 family)
MQNPFSTPTAQNFGLLLARVSCGACFMLMGYHHISGEGTRSFVSENMSHLPAWIGPRAGESYLTLVPFAELTFGALLTLGVLMRVSAFFLAIMLVSFVIVVPSLSSEKYPFHPNIILFGVAFALLTNGGGNMTLPHIMGKSGGSGAGKPAAAK